MRTKFALPIRCALLFTLNSNMGHFADRYLRKEHLTIMDVPMDAVRDGRIRWGNPPRWLNSSSAKTIQSFDTSINKIETGTKN